MTPDIVYVSPPIEQLIKEVDDKFQAIVDDLDRAYLIFEKMASKRP